MPQRARLALCLVALLLFPACENQPNTSSTTAPASVSTSFKETLKESTGRVADAAREGAANVAASAKEVAHVAKDEALQIAAAARDLVRTTKEQTVVAAQQTMDEARVQLAVLKEQKDRIQESLRPEYERSVAELSERVDAMKVRMRELKDAAPDAWRTTGQEFAPLVAEFRAKVDSAWNAYVRGGSVQGSVVYLERMLLPEDAELRLRLLDISMSDTNPEVLAEQSMRLAGAPPFAFELRFDPAKVHPKGTYAIAAEILIDGKRQFATDGPKRVAIGESTPKIELIVKRTE
jgi:putative lipoprotein